jgi:hypothetical protein
MNNIKKLSLHQYRGVKSSVYTGRPQGEQARLDLKLDDFDKSTDLIQFVVPAATTTITPSFFLGMLFNSIKTLGYDNFKKKYQFVFEETDPNIVDALNQNIIEGERNAVNTIKGNRGYAKFLK